MTLIPANPEVDPEFVIPLAPMVVPPDPSTVPPHVHGSEAYDPRPIARDLQIKFRCPFLLGRREPRH